MNFDRHIRARYSAYPAANAARWVMHLREEIPTHRNLLRHGDYLLRAGLHTQFTTFAVVLVYRNAGHQNTSNSISIGLQPERLSPTA
jgi:hypothetical protein